MRLLGAMLLSQACVIDMIIAKAKTKINELYHSINIKNQNIYSSQRVASYTSVKIATVSKREYGHLENETFVICAL